MSSIEFSKTKDAEMAWIDAILDIKESDENKDVNKENVEEETTAPGEWTSQRLFRFWHVIDKSNEKQNGHQK